MDVQRRLRRAPRPTQARPAPLPASEEGDGIILGAQLVLVIVSLVPSGWHARDHPAWYRQALCIHTHEGAWDANTGNGYYGGMQFLLGTWESVGGRALPSAASPREQLYRAWLVYRRDGGSWREWGTAVYCMGTR